MAEMVTQLVRSGGMLMALESGGVFETKDELIDCFCAAAKNVGVSLTVLDTGGRSYGVDLSQRRTKGGIGGGIGVRQDIQQEPLWVLFVCSKVPSVLDKLDEGARAEE